MTQEGRTFQQTGSNRLVLLLSIGQEEPEGNESHHEQPPNYVAEAFGQGHVFLQRMHGLLLA